MAKKIRLTKGQEAIVDDEDYEWALQWKWQASPQGRSKTKFRVVRARNSSDPPGPRTMYLHREIFYRHNKYYPKEIDHKDQNPLNNCKFNLRICSHSQNLSNRGLVGDFSSKFRGVSWKKNRSRWESYIKNHGKKIHIGNFETEEEAAKAYDKKAREFFGEFAILNFN